MYDTKQVTTGATFKVDGDEAGTLEAVISTFDVVDTDGDIVAKSAFTDGQPTPLVWAHDWTRIIGKGAIRVEDSRAVFKGRLFLDTHDGEQAYKTIKALGDLQEYSWGFQVTDHEYKEVDGKRVRVIKRAEVFEASPVLVGANRQTQTLSIKGYGLDFDAHSDQVRDALAEWMERCRAGSDLRQKRGRAISEARRQRMASVRDGLRSHADEIDAMLVETADDDPKALAVPDDLALLSHFTATRARLRATGLLEASA